MLSIQTIILKHAEEAAFLWLLRDAAVREPHYKLKDLAKLDDRVEAHIDGLRIAGDEGWEICQQALELEEPGEVFAASVLAFESGKSERIETVITAGAASVDAWRGLASAFGWLAKEKVDLLLPGLLTSENITFRRLGIAASAIHRRDPGTALGKALETTDSTFLARALRASGELKCLNLLPVLQCHYDDQEDSCRFWAAWSGLLLGDSAALRILESFLINNSSFRHRSAQLIFRILDNSQTQMCLKDLINKSGALRCAIQGAGVTGDPVRIPWLIELMSQPEQARVAGEAFSLITGTDVAYEDLEGEWPDGFEAGPTENPEDEDVELDQDEDLPWPNPELISAWWNKNKGNFQVGKRYLAGKPVSAEHCQLVLKCGFQRQRTAAALELALMSPSAPLFNVCAPGFRQQQMLGST